MLPRLKLIFLILFFAALFIIVIGYKMYSEPEVFGQRETLPFVSINDPPNDTKSNTKNAPQCQAWPSQLSSDIQAVQYYGNGKWLNATVWLSSPIEHETNYTMNFNSSPIYNTTFGYETTISWNDTNNSWTKTIEELSSNAGADKEKDPSERKTIEKIENFTGFYENGKNYIHFSTDLDKVALSEEFDLFFYVTDNYISNDGFSCRFTDFTDIVTLPTPIFTISTSSPFIELKPSEEKIIELQLNTSSKRDSVASLFTKNMTNNVEIDIIPKKIFVPSSGLSTTQLYVKALKNSIPGDYILPIYAQITFPRSNTNASTDNILDNTKEADVIENTAITITVSPPLTTEQQIESFFNSSNIGVSIIIISLIISGIIILVTYWYYQKKKKSRILFNFYNRIIDETKNDNNSDILKEQTSDKLGQIRIEILNLYREGILNELHFQKLYDKILKQISESRSSVDSN
jgi:hypothetical protein